MACEIPSHILWSLIVVIIFLSNVLYDHIIKVLLITVKFHTLLNLLRHWLTKRKLSYGPEGLIIQSV